MDLRFLTRREQESLETPKWSCTENHHACRNYFGQLWAEALGFDKKLSGTRCLLGVEGKGTGMRKDAATVVVEHCFPLHGTKASRTIERAL